MVDAQVGGDDLVTRRTVGALPFDEQWDALAQRVLRVEEATPVHERGREHVGVAAFLPRPCQCVPHIGRDVRDRIGPRRERKVDIVGTEHSQTGDDLGDRRPQVCHAVGLCVPAGGVLPEPLVACVGAHLDHVVDDVGGVPQRNVALTALPRQM